MHRKTKQLNTEECVALLNVDLVKDDAIATIRAEKFSPSPLSKKSKSAQPKKRIKKGGSSAGYTSLKDDNSDSNDSDSDWLSEEDWSASVAHVSENFESNSLELDAAGVKKLKTTELRKELKKRGLKSTGHKAILMKRLLEEVEAGKGSNIAGKEVVETQEAPKDADNCATLDAVAVKKLKLSDVRKELKKRGLKLTGLKSTLVKRLLEAVESENGVVTDETETQLADEVSEDENELTELDAAAVKKLKLSDLRKELKKRGLKSTGLKATLVKRLLEAVESENVVLADEAEAQPADEASADDEEELAELDAAAVKKLKLNDLRKELRRRGLKSTGLKATLVKRLLEAVESKTDEVAEEEEEAAAQLADEASEDEAGPASTTEATLLAEPVPARLHVARRGCSRTLITEPVPEVSVPGGYAIDIIGICDDQRRLHCTDFHVHFTGPSARWSCSGQPVNVYINDSKEPCQDFCMALAKAKHHGRCYFADGSLRPEPVVLSGLRDGENKIRFEHTIHERAKGKPDTKTIYVIEAKLFIWKVTDNVVVTDIDGTLTTSDIVGHIKTVRMSNYQYAHKGICGFFSSVDAAGLKILYLTARPITWMNETRAFLANVTQDGYLFLPDAPVMCSIHHTTEKLLRTIFRVEYADKIKTNYLFNLCEVFIRAGRKYRVSGNPLIAGFGNSKTDTRAYNAVQIPYTFDINKKSIITFSSHEEQKPTATIAAEDTAAAASASATASADGDEAGWQKWENSNAFPDDSASEMPFHKLELCKQLCLQMEYGGFAVSRGRVFFRPLSPEQCMDARRRADGVTFYRAPCQLESEAVAVVAEVTSNVTEIGDNEVLASFDDGTTVPVALIARVPTNEDLSASELALPVADPVAEAEVLGGSEDVDMGAGEDMEQPDVEQPVSPTSVASEDMQPVGEVDVSETEMDVSEDMEQPAVEEVDSVGSVGEAATALTENNDAVSETIEEHNDTGSEPVGENNDTVSEPVGENNDTGSETTGENNDTGSETTGEHNDTVVEATADTTETDETIDDVDVGQPESGATKVKTLLEPKGGGFFSLSRWLPTLFDIMSLSAVEIDVEALKKQEPLSSLKKQNVVKPAESSDDATSSSDSDEDEGTPVKGGFLSRLFAGRATETEVDKNVTIFNTYEDPKLHMLLDVMLMRCGRSIENPR